MFQHQQNKTTDDVIDNLLEKARSGDLSAFGELMGQHYHLVQRTAYRILKNTADAEDVTQEVSLKVLRKLHTFKNESAFSSWLTRIAINESLLFLRKAKRMPLLYIDEALNSETLSTPELTANTPCPEQLCLAKDELNWLYRRIARLPSNLRGVLSDQALLELPLIEIAKRQGLSVPAVKARIYRARKMLFKNLNMHRGAMHAAL